MIDGLSIAGLTVRHRHGPQVVHGIDFEARSGQVTALLGPNGAGKSSVLRAIVGLLPYTGSVLLDGEDVCRLTAEQRASRLGYVPQQSQLRARMSVRAVVELGRFVHRGPLGHLRASDHHAVDRAMEQAEVAALAERPFPELSGGEQRRVLLARALATGASTLLLDEPTSSLDVHHGLRLHRVVRDLAEAGCTVLMVVHDLTEAHHHADRAIAIDEGRVCVAGPVDEVIVAPRIREIYRVELIDGGGFGYRLPEAIR